MTTIKIHNVADNSEIEREMTEEEIIAWQKAQSDSEHLASEKAHKASVLEKLGITEEEAKLLLS